MKPSYDADIIKVFYNDKEISLFKEDLTEPLNEQAVLLGNLETEINRLPSLSDSNKYRPNADMLWAKSEFEKNVAEDEYAALQLFGDLLPTVDIVIPANSSVKTSDGGNYTNTSSSKTIITHTWDDTNARDSVSYKDIYKKIRWIIIYTDSAIASTSFDSVISHETIYCLFKLKTYNESLLFQAYNVQYCEFLTPFDKASLNMTFYCTSIQTIPQIDTSKVTAMTNTFEQARVLQTIPQLDTSNVTNMRSLFSNCSALITIPQLNTSNVTLMYNMFEYCSALITIPRLDTSNVTNMSNMFYGCTSLQTIPQLNTSKVTNMSYMFNSCTNLLAIPQLDTSNATTMYKMFQSCNRLQMVPQLSTSNVTNMSSMFQSCSNLKTILGIDLRSITSASNLSSIFNYCSNLTNLTIKNVKYSLQIGSGSSWGHKLTLDSLLNTIKELHDNTSGTSTLTLTVGSANLTKLADVYVKLIDITDEMRAEDEFIDLKKPFEVCESTDEGAMLITEYVTSKNWQLA